LVGSRTAHETAQPKKSGKVGVALVAAQSTGVERLRRKRPFSSQVGEEGFHFKLNIWRQSPQSLPTQHAEFPCLATFVASCGTSHSESVTQVTLQAERLSPCNATRALCFGADDAYTWRDLPSLIHRFLDDSKEKDMIEGGNYASTFSALASVAKQ
jgi:hypothetical protein